VRNVFSKLESILKAKGYKLTNQRIEILKIIYSSEKHITIEEIYHQLKEVGVGLSTIYRNIEIFKSNGIIKEISIDDKNYYEPRICKTKPFHIHFKCNKCGKVFDIEDKIVLEKVMDLNLALQQKHDITINDVNMILSGICKECSEKSSKSFVG
jgi:Fur family transcriptional regulator, ferric uptake regulator